MYFYRHFEYTLASDSTIFTKGARALGTQHMWHSGDIDNYLFNIFDSKCEIVFHCPFDLISLIISDNIFSCAH